MPRISTKELEDRVEELEGTLESINDLASEADDAALDRAEIIEKVREIVELSEGEGVEEGEEVD